MKNAIGNLVAKISGFLQQLAQKTPDASHDNHQQTPPSVSSAMLDLHLKNATGADVEGAEAVQTDVAAEVVADVAEVQVDTVVQDDVAEQAASEPEPEPEPEPAQPVVSVCSQVAAIPEDSALRRHFLTQRRAEILAAIGDEPSDSTLKRHYQQLLAARLAENC